MNIWSAPLRVQEPKRWGLDQGCEQAGEGGRGRGVLQGGGGAGVQNHPQTGRGEPTVSPAL